MSKIVCMGEALVDMIPEDSTNSKYLAKAGGAPANVCAAVCKLGGKGYYLGKLSTDGFGDMLHSTMEKGGVLLDYAIRDERYKTALALVTLSESGDRSFSFYRNETADLMLDEVEIPVDLFERGDMLHFCSVGLVESPSKYAHIRAINLAKKAGAMVSFDVNLRLGLYETPELCRETVRDFLVFADIVKLTDDELVFLTDSIGDDREVEEIFALAPNADAIFVTRGENGASVYCRDGKEEHFPAARAKVVDTTGAGDCFIGSMLYQIATNGKPSAIEKWVEYVRFSTVASAMVCEKKGAIESMPTYNEVKERL